METIGILGGVASGKSAVARMFEQLGAVRLDADLLGHAVLEEPEVRMALEARWGNGVLDDRGQIDRRTVAQIVFGDRPEAAAELKFLEATTHPRIASLLAAELSRIAAQGVAAAVLDAAVMVKAGWHQFCTRLVFVDVPRAERLRRALQRGWTAAQFAARERAQLPLEQKRQLAQTIIDNSGTLEETLVQVRSVWSSWSVGGV
jgi:dephospho-CoA kinase